MSRFGTDTASGQVPRGLVDIAQRLRLLDEHITEIIWIMDLDLTLCYASAETPGGTTLRDLVTPAALDLITTALASELTPERLARPDLKITWTGELEAYRQDRATFWCETTVTLLRDETGRPVGLLGVSRDISERKRKEGEPYRTQEHYRQLVENLNDAVFVMNMEGIFTYMSPVIRQISGYTAAECLGAPFTRFIHPDDLPTLKESFACALSGKTQTVEFRVIDKEHRIHYVRTSSQPLYENGHPRGVTGTISEITAQKQAELALAKSEERYRRIIESIEDGYYETDLTGNITFFNDQIPLIYGYSREELLGKNYRVFTDAPSAQHVYDTCHAMVVGDTSSAILDWEITRKNGQKISIENSISLMRDQNGHPIGFHGIVRDITQRRQTLQELHKLSQALEQSPVSVIITDQKGTIEYVNPKFTAITGYSVAEVLGQNPRILKSGEMPAAEYRRLWETITQGQEWRGELHNRKKDGTLFWETASISPVFDPSGTITHFVAVKEDITARKQMEEAQRQSEERYRMLTDNLSDVVCIITDQRFTDVSPSVLSQWGYVPQELIGQPLGTVFSPTSLEILNTLLKESSATPDAEEALALPIELEVIHKDGSHIWNETKFSFIRDSRGAVRAVHAVAHDITLKKFMEDALQDNLTLMQILTDAIPHPIFHTDIQGRLAGCNKAFVPVIGKEKGDVIGGVLEEVLPRDPGFARIMDLLLAPEDLSEPLERICYADGSRHDIIFSKTRFFNTYGEAIGTVGVMLDITAQKTQEHNLKKALEESERRQTEIVSLLAAAHAVVDSPDFAQAARAIFEGCRTLIGAPYGCFGVSVGESGLEEIVWSRMPPAVSAPMAFLPAHHANTVRRSGAPRFINDLSQDDAEGTPGIRHALLGPLMAHGRPEGMVYLFDKPGGFGPDDLRLIQAFLEFAAIALINARARRALETSERRFRSVAQTANDAFITVDSDTRIVFWNNMAERMFGYTGEEAMGNPFTLIIPARFRRQYNNELKKIVTVMKKVVATDTASIGRTAEMIGLRKGGQEFPIEISISTWESEGRRFFTTIIRDITERKLLESSLMRETADLRQARGELENAYRDLQASQAQMLQREKMASIGQLAAGVAHEINNPMGFISSNLGTLGKYVDKLVDFLNTQTDLVRTAVEEEARRAAEAKRAALKIDYIVTDIKDLIQESLEGAERVKKIVQDLKSFSRVDQAELKYADINECLESTLNIVWNELKYKATVIKEYGEIPSIKCYPQQINQVFMNLLVNAAQAIEKQGQIRVRSWREGDDIRVSIADTGGGIPPQNLERIFEPFFTTKEVGQGTGLGLSITYDIVKRHGGDIDVQSTIGQGTTFTVRLPVVEAKN